MGVLFAAQGGESKCNSCVFGVHASACIVRRRLVLRFIFALSYDRYPRDSPVMSAVTKGINHPNPSPVQRAFYFCCRALGVLFIYTLTQLSRLILEVGLDAHLALGFQHSHTASYPA